MPRKVSTVMLNILKKVDSSMFLIDFPDFLETSDLYASRNGDNDETCQHNHRLKHICPYHGLQTTLENKHICNWWSCHLVSQNEDGPGSIVLLQYDITVLGQSCRDPRDQLQILKLLTFTFASQSGEDAGYRVHPLQALFPR